MKILISAFLLLFSSFVYGETLIYQEFFSGEAASTLNQRSPEVGTSASEYIVVRPTTELPGNDIDSVGLISNKGAGKFNHFILRSTSRADFDLNN